MAPMITLWFTVMIGMPEINVSAACGESSDPTNSKYSEYFVYEKMNNDGAIIVRSKKNGIISDIYFETKSQCMTYLSKYDQLIRKEKYGE
jgi:hypothetical protein